MPAFDHPHHPPGSPLHLLLSALLLCSGISPFNSEFLTGHSMKTSPRRATMSGGDSPRTSTGQVSMTSSPESSSQRITNSASDGMMFPNPRFEPRACRRAKASFVCDPDGVLSVDDADKLEFLSNQVHTSTSCICANCPLGGAAGVSVGIFLKKNLTRLENSELDAQRLAARLRHQWQFGPCGDDIILVLLTEQKQSAMEVGPAVLHVVPLDVAEKIFHDSSIHFENGFYSQGLESMINSFRDILRRFQKQHFVSASTKRTGLIIGLSLGIVVLIILLGSAAMILTRQRRNKSKSRNDGRGISGWHKGHSPSDNAATLAVGYAPCRAEDKGIRNKSSGSSESDEDSDTDYPWKYNGHLETPNPRLRDPLPRRQLSYVAEETEEDDDDISPTQSVMFSGRVNRVRSTEVTEL